MGKKIQNITYGELRIIMFDHEDAKIVKVIRSLLIFFLHVKPNKIDHSKNVRLKGKTCITPINLWLLKIYSAIF